MRQFHETYPEITTALRSQLNWTHHRIIMSRCKTEEERLFYLQLAATERYSTRELVDLWSVGDHRQINSGIFERTRLADAKLSPKLLQADQTPNLTGVFRDSYVLDFLNLPPSHSEDDLQNALVHCLKDFILELGRDFTFLDKDDEVVEYALSRVLSPTMTYGRS